MVPEGLHLRSVAVQLSYDIFFYITDVVQLAPFHLDPFVQIFFAEDVLKESQESGWCPKAALVEFSEFMYSYFSKTEKEQIAQDGIQCLILSPCCGRMLVQETCHEESQKLQITSAAIDDLMDEFLFNLTKRLVFEQWCVRDMGINCGLFGVEALDDFDALL